MKRLFATLAVAACVAAPQGPALAVTDGTLDGNNHPYVGLLVFDVEGTPAWRCSGTLPSFGMNGTCGGTGGVFRLDRQNVLTFINDFIARPYSN